MKLKILPPILILYFFSIVAFATEKKFQVEVFFDKPIIRVNSKQVSLKVRISNLSADDFEVKNFNRISFYFLRWNKPDFYISDKNIINIEKESKTKALKPTEFVEFEIKPEKLKWRNRLKNTKFGMKFKELTPATYYFFAVVDVVVNERKSQKKFLERYGSNETAVRLESK